MSSTGKQLRLSQITCRQSGRIFLTTFDHGTCLGPLPGGYDVVGTIDRIACGGPDCIMVTPGIARAAAGPLAEHRLPVVARIDVTATVLGPDITDDNCISSVEAALRLGACGVGLFSVLGCARESQLSTKVGRVADECDRWGMPLLLELLPPESLDYQFRSQSRREWPCKVENVMFCARLAAEQGADVVKTFYTGDPDSFRRVVECTPIPVLVLSGPWADDTETLFRFVRDAIDAGAAGVSMGRNLWQHPHPTAVTAALAGVIHEGWTAAEAMEHLHQQAAPATAPSA